jgi:hypothetical protein
MSEYSSACIDMSPDEVLISADPDGRSHGMKLACHGSGLGLLSRVVVATTHSGPRGCRTQVGRVGPDGVAVITDGAIHLSAAPQRIHT